MGEQNPESEREQTLRETLDELTLDIGRILHANTSTLLMVNQTLIATIETLSSQTAPLDEADVEAEVHPQTTQLARPVERRGEQAVTGHPGFWRQTISRSGKKSPPAKSCRRLTQKRC